MQKKKTSPIVWLGLATLVVAAFMLTSSDDPVKKTTTTQPPAKKKAEDGLFTDEDYKAKFEPLNTATKNAFMPVVMRKNGAGGVELPNAVPTSLTGGEGGWFYTGTAEVDGKIQAIVENPSTGQGDFLSTGQHWKKAKVIAVTDSNMILEGPDGQQVTIKMLEKVSGGSTVAGGAGFAPLNPNAPLRGQIGRVGIRPENGANPATQAVDGDNNAN